MCHPSISIVSDNINVSISQYSRGSLIVDAEEQKGITRDEYQIYKCIFSALNDSSGI